MHSRQQLFGERQGGKNLRLMREMEQEKQEAGEGGVFKCPYSSDPSKSTLIVHRLVYELTETCMNFRKVWFLEQSICHHMLAIDEWREKHAAIVNGQLESPTHHRKNYLRCMYCGCCHHTGRQLAFYVGIPIVCGTC